METPKTTIVVPCYNEAKRLPVAQFREFVGAHDIHFVLVNDGSRDATSQVLDALRQTAPDRITVLDQKVNRGKAEAVRSGLSHAIASGSGYVGFWDADLATPLSTIPRFVEILAERPEILMVFGARVKLLGRRVERKAARHYLGRVFATFVSTILGLAIYDTQCGAKLFRVTPVCGPLFDAPFLSRWIFDVEILARYLREVGAAAAAESIYEYPLETWTDVAGSKLEAWDFAVAFFDLIRIRQAYLRGTPGGR